MAPPALRDLSRDASLLSLNTATVREQWNLRQCIEGCVMHGIGGIAPWRDRLAECGVKEAARLIRDSGLRVTGLCRGGMYPASDAAGRRAAIDDNRRAVDEAAEIGSACLVIVSGGLPPGSRDLPGARSQVRDGLGATLEHARKCGMPVAIEPLHPMYAADRCCVNTLRQANDLCEELGAGMGVAADVYHCWWDPELEREMARAGRSGWLLAVHVCDWLVPTRDLLLDRGMMGDGVADVRGFRALAEAAGYTGLYEVEIFSAGNWWRRDPHEVLRVCIERHRTVV
jgi:sugar phosphate isomerase/epimerase